MESKLRIVVLGAGYAGLMAAVRAAHRARGRAEVALVAASDVFVERIRLHQEAAGQVLRSWRVEDLLLGSGARFMRGNVTGIEPARREVTLSGRALGYDLLVIALGSRVDRSRIPGLEHASTLDPDSAARLGRALPAVAANHGRLLVCGGGLSGIEAATELSEAHPGLAVTLVTSGALGDNLSGHAQSYLRAAMTRRNIALVEHTPVRALAPRTAIVDGSTLPFDLCLWAGGHVASPLLTEGGLSVNDRGQARVDACLRSISHSDIYAAGDAAAPEGCHAPIVMACKTAMPMGAHVADNLAARACQREERPFAFGDSGICVSVGRRDGVIQLMRRDGTLSERILTGRLAAWIKERVCRYTVNSIRNEARGRLAYRWPKPARLAPALALGDGKNPDMVA